ncbi:transcription elongation GreA/GreB family factor [Loktanella ponticola]|uniref:Transcription elongation GreA/GreB family factor n=1 Tax=Yoonia ponticola TaxID=1524255 RepID=A0A7W9BP16_9RHOB|nr:GreA/GreB family elongation factor [Yoonia ponticola]MBB5723569.1 transcription elongation GreA/GreB family factor [Yoonia ponticola]|tara:strand:+ start:55443 stop:55940 length:498 start_codon:yes stop_codon:yes gene_type:complete
MSKAFTKEEDGTENVRLDDLPQSPHPNLVTPSGLSDLNTRLVDRRLHLVKLREKPDEIDRKLAVAVIERDIRFLEGRISRAIPIDPESHPNGIVAFGAEVDVLNEDDQQLTFKIVGEDEADPARGLIAPYSPLGVALLGGELGSSVEWHKPTGSVDLEIVAIRFQ